MNCFAILSPNVADFMLLRAWTFDWLIQPFIPMTNFPLPIFFRLPAVLVPVPDCAFQDFFWPQ